MELLIWRSVPRRPESLKDRDREEKYKEYQSAGVQEYWIIDPALRRADFFALRGGAFAPWPPEQGWHLPLFCRWGILDQDGMALGASLGPTSMNLHKKSESLEVGI